MSQGNKPTVAIVTGTSNTGCATIRHLLKDREGKFNIRAAVHDPKELSELSEFKDKISIVKGVDGLKKDTLNDVYKGCSVAFITPPDEENRDQITFGLIDGAKSSGVKHIVLISVPSADSNSDILYRKQFGKIEERVKNSGMTYTFLRSNMFMDNCWTFRNSILNEKMFYGCSKDGKYAHTCVDDVGNVAATVLANLSSHQNKSYFLTGPESLTNNDIARNGSKAFGFEIKYKDMKDEEFAKWLTSAGWPKWKIDQLMPLFKLRREGQLDEVSNDVKNLCGHTTTWMEYLTSIKSDFLNEKKKQGQSSSSSSTRESS